MAYQQKVTKQVALQKAMKYCVYQERCHLEVRQKLYEWGLFKKEVEEILSELIEQNFLNEERFAIAYAGGKFRIKQWGKNKIERELHQKKISAYCISKALKQIEQEDYLAALHKILIKKSKFVLEDNPFKRKNKIASFAIQKGYEPELVWEEIKKVIKH